MDFRRPLATFYSYTHKDRRHLDDLKAAVSQFRRNGDLDEWDDREIRGGQDWEEKLVERARKARMFLLLVTNRFIDSDYCVGRELKIARILWESRSAGIAPIIVEDCNWKIDELVDLQVIQPFGKPVRRSSNKAGAWTEAGLQVKKIADDLLTGNYFSLDATKPEIPVLLPYSIGRSGDEEAFQARLAAAERKRPLVVILTGERQGQRQFVELLMGENGPIRKTLRLSSACAVLTIDDHQWIRSGESPENRLNAAISALLDPAPATADRDAVATAIAQHPGLTLLQCTVTVADWRAGGAGSLDQFLRYWEQWPELKLDRPVIVFLCIQADVDQIAIDHGYWQPLAGIRRETVDQWLATEPAVSRFLAEPIGQKLDLWLPRGGSMRMEDFADKFLPLLRKYQV